MRNHACIKVSLVKIGNWTVFKTVIETACQPFVHVRMHVYRLQSKSVKMCLCILVFALTLYWSTQEEEFYVCIYATREGDHVLFHHEGGVEVGDVDAKAQRLMVAVDEKLSEDQVTEQLLTHVSDDKKEYGHIVFFIYVFIHTERSTAVKQTWLIENKT